MLPESVKNVTGDIVASYAVFGRSKLVFQIPMFPESIKYATGDIVASCASLGSGKLVFSDPNVPRID